MASARRSRTHQPVVFSARRASTLGVAGAACATCIPKGAEQTNVDVTQVHISLGVNTDTYKHSKGTTDPAGMSSVRVANAMIAYSGPALSVAHGDMNNFYHPTEPHQSAHVLFEDWAKVP